MHQETPSEELKAITSLNALDSGDPESGHLVAEDIVMTYLRQSGHPDVAEAFEVARHRVGFWYA